MKVCCRFKKVFVLFYDNHIFLKHQLQHMIYKRFILVEQLIIYRAAVFFFNLNFAVKNKLVYMSPQLWWLYLRLLVYKHCISKCHLDILETI